MQHYSSMKRYLSLAILFVALYGVITIPMMTGCGTTQAARYNSLKTTWDVSYEAYFQFQKRVVRGKVSPEKEFAVDASWNLFRNNFKLAMRQAQNDDNAPTPEFVATSKAKLFKEIE